VGGFVSEKKRNIMEKQEAETKLLGRELNVFFFFHKIMKMKNNKEKYTKKKN
jgi:hypothetical protein